MGRLMLVFGATIHVSCVCSHCRFRVDIAFHDVASDDISDFLGVCFTGVWDTSRRFFYAGCPGAWCLYARWLYARWLYARWLYARCLCVMQRSGRFRSVTR